MAGDTGTIRAALIQMAMSDDPAANLETAVVRLREAAAGGATVACLPELYRTPYFCQSEDPRAFDLAEPVPGPTTNALAALAREHRMVVVAPLFERRAPGLYHNSAVVIERDGSLAGLYRKMHIPDDPGYYEKYYFAPGDLGFRCFDTSAGRIGVLICWDQWFPEAARLVALQGADLVLVPTAIGWHPRERQTLGDAQVDAWITVQRGHAIANGIYWAAVNRIGHERPAPGHEGLQFWGSTFACDPHGIMLARAPADAGAVLLVDADRRRVEAIRRAWPFLRDRRVDAAAPLAARWLGPDCGSTAPSVPTP
ncbi:MAG: carbon-nitrogen hydrolase [Lentisphaerae bacterium]|nr:carbon-nitrogen hydrolase [Lentisphaerota bacterium]